jgi:hypothetical protein
VTFEVIFRFSGPRSGLGVVRLLSPPSRALCGCCRVRCTGRSFVRVGPSRRPRIDPRALAAALLLLQLPALFPLLFVVGGLLLPYSCER